MIVTGIIRSAMYIQRGTVVDRTRIRLRIERRNQSDVHVTVRVAPKAHRPLSKLMGLECTMEVVGESNEASGFLRLGC